MCVMTAAAVGMAVVGTVAKAASASSEANAKKGQAMQQKQMAQYQAQVATNNAKIMEQNAEYAMSSGQTQASNTSMRNSARFGMLKAAQGASGVDVNSGSAVDVQASERSVNQLDAETVLNNAQRQAYGYRVKQTEYEAQSDMAMMGATMAQRSADDAGRAGDMAIGTSVIQGASQVIGSFGGGMGGGGGFAGTAEGLAQYGSAGYAGSSSYGGPR